jgi:glycosyltransferase involved in cell wall biosynthesis
LVQSAVAGDSRVLREAEALVAAGSAVHLVGRGVPEGFVPPPGVTVDSVGRSAGLRPTGRPGSRPGPAVARPVLRAGRWLLLPEHRARVEAAWRAGAAAIVDAYLEHGPPDVVHAHDFNTLELAAAVAQRTGAALVYDAHELWAGRARVGRPEPLRRRRAAAREDALMGRADLVLTVSQGIAERLRSRGARRVVVVRNSFPARPDGTPLPRHPTGLVYAGRIGPGRDLETLAAAAPELAALGARPVVVGPADADYLARFPRHAAGVDLRPTSLSPEEVDEAYRAAGLAVVTLDGSCENHRLALPNKLFHAVRAGVPVVAADLPELARVVTERRLGATYRPGDPDSLAAAVADVVGRYPQAVAAVADAAPELSWERDAAVLVAAYADLPARRSRPAAVAGSPAR